MIQVALPKGRLGEKAYETLAAAGYECPSILEKNRKLTFENPEKGVRYFWVKPSDVSINVERGAADVGIAGKDILLEYRPDVYELLDLNMGCPAPKITGGGAGSKLMLDPPLCGAMVRAARAALGEEVPLTVKMRIGWDDDHLTGPEVARQCEAGGADLLVVHGRTREQMYVPPVHWDQVAAVKQAVGIPVFANGDITSPERAVEAVRETGCDGVMIGRGALGDPWLFERVNAALAGQTPPLLPTLPQRMAALRRQIYEMCEEKGEWAAMPQARSQAMHYMKGLRGAAALRRACAMLSRFEDVDTLIDAVYRCNE